MSSRSTGSRLAGKRMSAIAVVTAVIAGTGSVLAATPAAAAVSVVSTVTIDSASLNTNQPAGALATATLHVSYVTNADGGTAPAIDYTFSPPGGTTPAPTFPAGAVCLGPNVFNGPGVLSTATCTIPDPGGNPGTWTVEAFADNGGTVNSFDTGVDKISGPATVTFSGPPHSLTLTPVSSISTNGTCVLYKLTATDINGQLSVGQPVAISVTENSTSAPGPFRFYNSDCETLSGLAITPSNVTATSITDTVNVTTLNDGPADNGTFVLGIASNDSTPTLDALTGNGTIVATFGVIPNQVVSNTVAATWTPGGEPAVTSLAITAPTDVTQYTGTTAKWTVTATDHNNSPVEGVVISAQSDGTGPGGAPTCGTTNHLGQVTCQVHNNGTAGTDILTFWADNGLIGAGHTNGPDSDEHQVRATALFRTTPAYSAANSSLSCIDQLVATKGTALQVCHVPTSQTSVTFTQKLVDGSGNPVVGAIVEFDATFTPAAIGTVPNTFVTTDATGTATLTVTDATPANNDKVDVISYLGAGVLGTSEANWLTPTTTTLSLTPALQTVTKIETVSVTAQIADQFGNPVSGIQQINYSAVGTQDNVNSSTNTTASGTAIITYTSATTAPGEDTINANTPTGFFATPVKVEFVNGAPTAASVVVDTTGNGSGTVCPATTGTPNNTNLQVLTANTHVCAIVKNAGGELLAGKAVTFTVDIGQIDANNPTATSTKTYLGTTNKNGIATAVVSSTKSGTQTVTATADGTSGSGMLTYALPTIDKARNIVISPTSATITAGTQQKFTWTVTDQFANPIAGVTVTYTQAGPGLPGGASSGTLVTGADGTASIVISTTSTDNGAGSVVGTIQQPAPPTPLNQCGNLANVPTTATTAGNCTAAATYTVLTGSPPSSVALHVASGVKKGHTETVTATVKHADGTPAVGQVIRFLVTGANGLIGSAVTNAAGVATFTYTASHAGTDAISAYDDINDDQLQESNEPGHHLKAVIGGVTDKPTIHLTTSNGTVTIHVATHPAMPHVLVTYYVKRYGSFHRIGTSRAGTLGRASDTFFFPKGVVRHFKARVNSKQGIIGAKTKVRTIRIR